MKNTTLKVSRASTASAVRTTCAPTDEDAPARDATDTDVVVTSSVQVKLSEGSDGEYRFLEWKGVVHREMEADGDDPTDGARVRLTATYSGREMPTADSTWAPRHYSQAVTFGPLENLTVAEFRRVLAGLNALAAALPAFPELGR